MSKTKSLDRRLEALYILEDDPASAPEKLPAFLRDKSNIVVAKAANMAARLEASGLAADLAQIFLPMLRKADAADPGCVALTAVAKALVSFDAPAAEVYFAGIRHFQWQPGFGPPTEVAGELRGLCARGLVRMGHPEALLHVLPLMADSMAARIGAIRALGETGKAEGELLLRLHAIHGDPDAEVMGECFTALLGLMPQRSLSFVEEHLKDATDEVAEMAALALGESRLSAAFPILRDTWLAKMHSPVRRSVLFAIAMLRRDEAFEWLLSLLDEPGSRAVVISALAIHKNDDALRARVEEKVRSAADPQLERLYEQEWGR